MMSEHKSNKLPMAATSSLEIQTPLELGIVMFISLKPMLLATSCGRRPLVAPAEKVDTESSRPQMVGTSSPEILTLMEQAILTFI
jgi:hypothetical protein